MSFRPCLVVPVFDPGPALERTVEALLPWGLPLFLTDDGSGTETRHALEVLAATHPLVRLARLEPNQGKGAAVMDGLRRARAEGFTHALQVDADGQHDSGAVGSFLEAGRARPEAVIAGHPRFDGTAPPSRKYGRWANDLWVHINTLSVDIRDSLCGFRLYPLASTCGLMDRVPLGRRMTFDTEIIVRLHRAGVPVVSVPVGVTYPEGGASHFRPTGDTLRLIALHVGFFFSLPWALATSGPRPWHRIRERGGALGLRVAFRVHRLLGNGAVRLLARAVTPYFLLTSPRARRASRDYLTRLHRQCGPLPGLPGEPRLAQVYAHFQAFSRSIVDTFLAWSGQGRALAVDFPDFDAFLELRRSGRGAIFLGAHLGNLQMIRALAQEKGLTGIHAVVHSENAERFHRILQRANPAFTDDLVQVSRVTPETALALQERVARGEFLFIMGDRTPPTPGARTLQTPFLGAPATLAQGPYFLAHLLRCPVYLITCCREGESYRVHYSLLAERIELPRRGREEAMAVWAARYAAALEAQCRRTPFEWFNFFDFWSSHPQR